MDGLTAKVLNDCLRLFVSYGVLDKKVIRKCRLALNTTSPDLAEGSSKLIAFSTRWKGVWGDAKRRVAAKSIKSPQIFNPGVETP